MRVTSETQKKKGNIKFTWRYSLNSNTPHSDILDLLLKISVLYPKLSIDGRCPKETTKSVTFFRGFPTRNWTKSRQIGLFRMRTNWSLLPHVRHDSRHESEIAFLKHAYRSKKEDRNHLYRELHQCLIWVWFNTIPLRLWNLWWKSKQIQKTFFHVSQFNNYTPKNQSNSSTD